jgi:hypothetical protein
MSGVLKVPLSKPSDLSFWVAMAESRITSHYTARAQDNVPLVRRVNLADSRPQG